MGRNKKRIDVNMVKFDGMTASDKLTLISDYNQLFHYELSKIPYSEMVVLVNGKAEDIAEEHYRKEGFQVYRSRIKYGYRSIGVEFYWQEYKEKLSSLDRDLITLLKSIMSPNDFRDLAMIVQIKSGTPDLLLIKNDKISFVEVKFNHELVKPSTVEFFLKYGGRWPISIIRIIRKTNKSG